MSSNYCIQLEENNGFGQPVIAMTTLNPINAFNLQFSLSINSLVVFLFSKFPFNYGCCNFSCINQDAFGFAQVGQNFNINLLPYQGYYMLIIIYPEQNVFVNVSPCQFLPGMFMTFQNTTVSMIDLQNLPQTVTANFGNQYETGFCKGINLQNFTVNGTCNNLSYGQIIMLNELNIQLITLTCQTFDYVSYTTVGFVLPQNCQIYGVQITAPIAFSGNQEVIDFLNNQKIPYSIVSPSKCKISYKSIPCKSISQITKLLVPPKKRSIISSKLWNEIILDLYLAYSVYKYINYLSQFPYIQNIYRAINDFYNLYENLKPYIFTPLIKARKGLPLTTDYFNSLIDAIIELANMANIELQKGISHVQPDQIVKSLQFDDIIYNVNQLLTFNYNQYFLLDCNGNKFYNLLNSISTFLNVLINSPINDIIIPNNVYIKNFLIYSNLQTFYIYGSIVNFLMYINNGYIYLFENVSVNSFILQKNLNTIEINDNSYINNLLIIQNSGTININNNTFIKTLKINNNNNTININDYVVIENLICKQNNGIINIASTATIINNYCTS